MTIPAKIINRYIPLNKVAVKILQITVKESVMLNFGDSIILNPKKPNGFEIRKNELIPYSSK